MLALLALILPATAMAQQPALDDAWRWAAFSRADSLPSISIYRITRSIEDRVWVLTDRGVAWFDDYVWHPVEIAGVAPGSVTGLNANASGGLWLVADGRLYRGNTAGFEAVPMDAAGEPVEVLDVQPRQTDLFVLAAAADGGERAFVFRNGELEPETLPEFPANYAERISESRRSAAGSVWLQSRAGIGRWSESGFRPLIVPPSFDALVLGEISELKSGAGLAALHGLGEFGGLWEWDDRGAARQVPGLRRHRVVALDLDDSGRAVAVAEPGGVWMRDAAGWHSQPAPLSLRAGVRAVRFDSRGDLWFGTDHGLFLFRASLQRWSTPLDPGDGLAVRAILPGPPETWLGTQDGLRVLAPARATRSIRSVLGQRLGQITAVQRDDAGNVWVGSGASFTGAFRWDGSKWRHFGAAEGLHSARVHSIQRDAHGDLWFLGIAESPLDDQAEPGAYVLRAGHFTRWGTAEGLPSGRVYSFVQDQVGAFWFGTRAGLSRWQDGVWKHWGVADGLRSARVYSLAVDGDGRVWFAHNRLGLGTLDGDRVRYLDRADGLPSSTVFALTVDADGRLWIGTLEGLASLYHGIVATFGAREGLAATEVAALQATAGALWVATGSRGVQVLHTAASQRHAPRIQLRDESTNSADGRRVRATWQVHAYRGDLSAAEIRSRSRVDGGAWSAWGLEREIIIADPAAGTHLLEVEANGLFGDSERTTGTLRILVPVPWYRRPGPWAGFAATLVAIGLLASLARQRERHLQVSIDALRSRQEQEMEHARDAVVVHDLHGTILRANTRFGRLTATNPARLPGAQLVDVAPSEVGKDLEDALEQLAAVGSWEGELQFSGKRGPRTVEVSSHTLGPATGQVRTAMRDVTALTQALDRAALWNEVYTKTGVGVMVVENGVVTRGNARAAEMLGYPDLAGMPVISMVAPEDRELARNSVAAIRWQRSIVREERILRADGTTFPALIVAKAIGARHEHTHVTTLIDLSEQAAAERERARHEQIARVIMESSPDQFVLLDPDGTIRYANHTLDGEPAKHVIGESFVELSPRDHRQELAAMLARVAANAEPVHIAGEYLYHGQARILERSAAPVLQEGQVVAVAMVIRDVTEARRATQELRSSRGQLRRLALQMTEVREQERQSIARDIHDHLGQALTALKLDAAWLASRLGTPDQTVGERFAAMGALLDSTIEDVRQLAARLRPPLLDELGLVDLIRWQLEEFAAHSELPCSVQLEHLDRNVDTDRKTAVFRILQEALTNVTRHADARRIEVILEQEQGVLMLTVSDDGKGFDADARRSEGLGIVGMSERAGAFGGELTVLPRVSGGTMVRLRLPLDPPRPASEREAEA